MNKTSASEKRKSVQNNLGWERILQDAEVTLRETKARARAIKRSMRVIQSRIQSGEPLPEYLNASTQS
jgi:hypothetical protein